MMAGDGQSNEDDIVKTSSARVFSSLCSGAAAGALAKTTIAPLDRTKIYFQTHPEKRYRIRGAVKFLKLTYQNDGFLRLWRGNSATLVRVVPYAAIQFTAHDQYKKVLQIDQQSVRQGVTRPPFLHFLAGSFAGITAQAMTYPLDRARAVMAVTRFGEYRSIFHVFQKIVSVEGPQGLYRGFVPTMLGVIPYAGVSFFTNENMKKYLSDKAARDRPQSPSLTMFERLLSGACAGIFGQVTSYPLDIVRRRMQTAVQMGFSKDMYTSVVGTLVHVYRKEGILRGWYKGLSMNFIKGPIAVSMSFTSYDYLKIFFDKVFQVEVLHSGHSR